jgi:tetratricopeptide (TPR) repeat protein
MVVRLAEWGQNPDGSFRVRVSFGDFAEYDVDVAHPANHEYEERLAWYFEEHLRYPFLDKDLEQAAVQQITVYGEALFQQVFGGVASYNYRRLRDRAFDGCRIEISGSAGLHRLHWEAMRDPDVPAPLTVRLPVTRRVEALGSKFEPPAGRPTLNILVVVARPDGPADVGYRTISRPLLDSLRTAGLPVTVDLVRPGTWRALLDHLQAATEKHGSGWYQVIHFDLHGAFSRYAPLEEGRRRERLLFATDALEPFEGRRGFLFFETAQEGKANPVSAEKVAGLLAEHRVPVAVLNACQSAMQDASEAGLAQRLAEAGVPVAVGMAYSVTVSAAELAMPVLYRKIADRAELTSAVHAARRHLYENKARRAYFGQTLDLEDWMLPVMFAQYPLRLGLRPMTDLEQAQFYEHLSVVGDEPTTEYGFVGRDLDIQAIEHRVLADIDSNQLLVQGMAGAGKSTVLAHLAWWWQRTSLVQQVFRFSYEDRAWTSAQIVREIRARLLSPVEHVQADAMSQQAQAEQVAQLLRATRHLLILDNTESVTAAPAAIPHALTREERDKLKAFLTRLHGGRTLVLLGSREPETWLTADNAGPGTYELPGLDTQAASVLVERILGRHRASHYLRDAAERDALQELVSLLGGYPLPLTVVLPVLASASPSAIVADLKAGGPAADPAGLISRAIEYSHGKLDPALQNSLLLLAPFTSVISTGPLLNDYRDHLLQDEAIQALGPIDLAEALGQAISVGLATPHSEIRQLVRVQPVLPYFLRSRIYEHPALHTATQRAHYQIYCLLANELTGLLSTRANSQAYAIGQSTTNAEYANLTTALAYGLQNGQPITAIIRALDAYLGRTQEHESRRHLFDEAIAAYPDPASHDQQVELAQLHESAGRAALDQHRLDAAKAHEETALRLLTSAGDPRQLGGIYHLLGIIAQRQRRLSEADTSYRKALDIYLQSGDQHNAAGIYHQLGRIAREERRYEQANANYRKALAIWVASGNRQNIAEANHQLGVVAHDQQRYDEAENNYRKALDTRLEYSGLHDTAKTYHQLGMLARDQQRYDEAENNYRKALDIWLQHDDQYNAAATYAELGILTQDQQRYDEAENNYRKALDIWLQHDDERNAAVAYLHLGALAQGQQRYDQAEINYRESLEIYGEFDLQAASSTAIYLGTVLAELGQHREAVQAFMYASITWLQETGQWALESLQGLHRERDAIGREEFTSLMTENISSDLARVLATAIERAGISGDTYVPDEMGGSPDM